MGPGKGEQKTRKSCVCVCVYMLCPPKKIKYEKEEEKDISVSLLLSKQNISPLLLSSKTEQGLRLGRRVLGGKEKLLPPSRQAWLVVSMCHLPSPSLLSSQNLLSSLFAFRRDGALAVNVTLEEKEKGRARQEDVRRRATLP